MDDEMYPPNIPYRERRPRGEDTTSGTIGFGLLGLVLTANPLGALVGGAIGNALANQPQPLETALRNYFSRNNILLISFYRLGPKAAKVLFRHRNQFWTVTSHAPDSPFWTNEKLEDWLYGDVVQQLGRKLSDIDARLAS